jgi:hypothetical protein
LYTTTCCPRTKKFSAAFSDVTDVARSEFNYNAVALKEVGSKEELSWLEGLAETEVKSQWPGVDVKARAALKRKRDNNKQKADQKKGKGGS